MLFARRRRLERTAEAEAKGRSLWTDSLGKRARRRLWYQVQDLKTYIADNSFQREVNFLTKARDYVVRDTGLTQLSSTRRSTLSPILNPTLDALDAIMNAEEEIVFSLLEALISLPNRVKAAPYDLNIISHQEAEGLKQFLPNFIENVRIILREHRVEYDIVGGQFIRFRSRIMHESIVVPALTLLGNHKEYDNVEKAYKKALAELHDGNPDDAITDASTALQEALSALGCEGNSLGPLANSAIVKKVIDSHDKKLIDWVSADRSTKGDAHSVSSASTEDAWLTLHVAGAIILRICGGSLRSSEEAR